MLRQVRNFRRVKGARASGGGQTDTFVDRGALGFVGRGFESIGKKGFPGSSREDVGREIEALGCNVGVRF